MKVTDLNSFFSEVSEELYLDLDKELVERLVSFTDQIETDLKKLRCFELKKNTPIFYSNHNLVMKLDGDTITAEDEGVEKLKSLTDSYEFTNITVQQKEKV